MADLSNIRGGMPGASGTGLSRSLDAKPASPNADAIQQNNATQYRRAGSAEPVDAGVLVEVSKRQRDGAEMFVAKELFKVTIGAMPHPASVQLKVKVEAGTIADKTDLDQVGNGQFLYLKPGAPLPTVNLLATVGAKTVSAQRAVEAAFAQAPGLGKASDSPQTLSGPEGVRW